MQGGQWSSCAVVACLTLGLGTAPAAAQVWGEAPPPQEVVPGVLLQPEARQEPRRTARPDVSRGPDLDVDPDAARVLRRRVSVQPTSLELTVAHANITSRESTTAFAADLSRVLAAQPDLVTLNEAVRPDEMLAREGYDHYRGYDSRWTMETTVMWSQERFDALATGTRYLHRRPGTWGTRAVNWVVLQDRSTGKVLSLVSAHPSPDGPSSHGLLPVYIGGLSTLVSELSLQGPVFVGGDLNAHYTSGRFPRSGLSAAGLTPTYDVWGMPSGGTGDHGGSTIDYVLFQPAAGIESTSQWKVELASDHDAVLGTFRWTF